MISRLTSPHRSPLLVNPPSAFPSLQASEQACGEGLHDVTPSSRPRFDLALSHRLAQLPRERIQSAEIAASTCNEPPDPLHPSEQPLACKLSRGKSSRRQAAFCESSSPPSEGLNHQPPAGTCEPSDKPAAVEPPPARLLRGRSTRRPPSFCCGGSSPPQLAAVPSRRAESSELPLPAQRLARGRSSCRQAVCGSLGCETLCEDDGEQPAARLLQGRSSRRQTICGSLGCELGEQAHAVEAPTPARLQRGRSSRRHAICGNLVRAPSSTAVEGLGWGGCHTPPASRQRSRLDGSSQKHALLTSLANDVQQVSDAGLAEAKELKQVSRSHWRLSCLRSGSCRGRLIIKTCCPFRFASEVAAVRITPDGC